MIKFFDESNMNLKYRSKGKEFELTFNEKFLLDGEAVNVEYPRYDSPYAQADKKDKTLTYRFNGKALHLDFENLIREF